MARSAVRAALFAAFVSASVSCGAATPGAIASPAPTPATSASVAMSVGPGGCLSRGGNGRPLATPTPGEYRTCFFRPAVTLRVDANGWAVGHELEDFFDLARPTSAPRGFDLSIITIRPGGWTDVAAELDALRKNASFTVSEPEPVTIGGGAAVRFDVSARAQGELWKWTSGSIDLPPGGRVRIYALQVAGRLVNVGILVPPDGPADAFERAAPVLGSYRFTP